MISASLGEAKASIPTPAAVAASSYACNRRRVDSDTFENVLGCKERFIEPSCDWLFLIGHRWIQNASAYRLHPKKNYGVTSNTTPFSLSPPIWVTPYKLPFLSMVKRLVGQPPSGPPVKS